jgi:hypothetical protein
LSAEGGESDLGNDTMNEGVAAWLEQQKEARRSCGGEAIHRGCSGAGLLSRSYAAGLVGMRG